MEDLIKRSDAIKAIWAEDINSSEDGMVFEAQSHIDRDIRLIPSADRPQGEWIIHSNGKMCDCSACNESYDRTFEYVDEWNFCPNCGARMKGADDE